MLWIYRPGGILWGGWLANRDSVSAVGIVSREGGICGLLWLQSVTEYLFLANIGGVFILAGGLGAGLYHSMEFRHFPSVSYFPRILSVKSLGNS